MQPSKTLKFQFELQIEEARIVVPFKSIMQILLKRGQQKIPTKTKLKRMGGERFHVFNQVLCLKTGLVIDSASRLFQDKEASLSLILLTEVGNKIGGVAQVSLSGFLNQQIKAGKSPTAGRLYARLQQKLDKSPDSQASLVFGLAATFLYESHDQNSIGSSVSVSSHSSSLSRFQSSRKNLLDITFRMGQSPQTPPPLGEDDFRKRCNQKEDQVGQLTKRVAQLQKTNNEAINKHNQLIKKYDQDRLALVASVQRSNQQLTAVNTRCNSLLAELSQTKDRLKDAQARGARLEDCLNQQQKRYHQCLQISKNFEEQLSQMEMMSHRYSQDMSLKEKELASLRNQLDASNQQLSTKTERERIVATSISTKLGELEEQSNKWFNRSHSLQTQLNGLRQQREQQLRKLNAECMSWRNQAETVANQSMLKIKALGEASQRVMEQQKQQISSLKFKISALEGDCSGFRQHKLQIERRLTQVNLQRSKVIQHYRKETEDWQRKIGQKDRLVEVIKGELEKLFNQHRLTQQRASKSEDDCRQMRLALANKQEECYRVVEDNRNLRGKLQSEKQERCQAIAKTKQLQQQLEQKQKKIKGLQDKLQGSKVQFNNSAKRIRALEAQCGQTLHRYTLLQKQKEQAQTELAVFMKKKGENDRKIEQALAINEGRNQVFQRRLKQQEQKRIKSQSQAKQALSQSNQLKQQLKIARVNLKQLRDQSAQLKQKLGVGKQEQARCKEDIKKLRQQLFSFRLIQEQSIRLKAELVQQKQGSARLKEQLKRAVEQYNRLKQALLSQPARSDQIPYKEQFQKLQKKYKHLQNALKILNDKVRGESREKMISSQEQQGKSTAQKDAIIKQCWESIAKLQERLAQEMGLRREEARKAQQMQLQLQQRVSEKAKQIQVLKQAYELHCGQQNKYTEQLQADLAKLKSQKSNKELGNKLAGLARVMSSLLQQTKSKLQFVLATLKQGQSRSAKARHQDMHWLLRLQRQQIEQKLKTVVQEIELADFAPLVDSFQQDQQFQKALLARKNSRNSSEQQRLREELRNQEREHSRREDKMRKLQRQVKRLQQQNIRLNIKIMRQLSQIKKRHDSRVLA